MLRTGAVVAAGLDRSENAFPLFLRTWNALIDDTVARGPDSAQAARPR